MKLFLLVSAALLAFVSADMRYEVLKYDGDGDGDDDDDGDDDGDVDACQQ